MKTSYKLLTLGILIILGISFNGCAFKTKVNHYDKGTATKIKYVK